MEVVDLFVEPNDLQRLDSIRSESFPTPCTTAGRAVTCTTDLCRAGFVTLLQKCLSGLREWMLKREDVDMWVLQWWKWFDQLPWTRDGFVGKWVTAWTWTARVHNMQEQGSVASGLPYRGNVDVAEGGGSGSVHAEKLLSSFSSKARQCEKTPRRPVAFASNIKTATVSLWKRSVPGPLSVLLLDKSNIYLYIKAQSRGAWQPLVHMKTNLHNDSLVLSQDDPVACVISTGQKVNTPGSAARSVPAEDEWRCTRLVVHQKRKKVIFFFLPRIQSASLSGDAGRVRGGFPMGGRGSPMGGQFRPEGWHQVVDRKDRAGGWRDVGWMGRTLSFFRSRRRCASLSAAPSVVHGFLPELFWVFPSPSKQSRRRWARMAVSPTAVWRAQTSARSAASPSGPAQSLLPPQRMLTAPPILRGLYKGCPPPPPLFVCPHRHLSTSHHKQTNISVSIYYPSVHHFNARSHAALSCCPWSVAALLVITEYLINIFAFLI